MFLASDLKEAVAPKGFRDRSVLSRSADIILGSHVVCGYFFSVDIWGWPRVYGGGHGWAGAEDEWHHPDMPENLHSETPRRRSF